MGRIGQLFREETVGFRPRLLLARLAVAPMPPYVGSRFRATALRLAGFQIGHGTLFAAMPAIAGEGDLRLRLRIGTHCWFNVGLRLDLGDRIEIGDHVTMGHDVLLLTTSHAFGGPQHRAGGLTTAPIRIEQGAWLGTRCTVLPGVIIGEGAVVGAGAVVTCDVPPNTVVGGVPARVLRVLAEHTEGFLYAA